MGRSNLAAMHLYTGQVKKTDYLDMVHKNQISEPEAIEEAELSLTGKACDLIEISLALNGYNSKNMDGVQILNTKTLNFLHIRQYLDSQW